MIGAEGCFDMSGLIRHGHILESTVSDLVRHKAQAHYYTSCLYYESAWLSRRAPLPTRTPRRGSSGPSGG